MWIQAANDKKSNDNNKNKSNNNFYSGKFSDSNAGNAKCFPRLELPKIISQVVNMIVIEQPIHQ